MASGHAAVCSVEEVPAGNEHEEQVASGPFAGSLLARSVKSNPILLLFLRMCGRPGGLAHSDPNHGPSQTFVYMDKRL
jgi:hypothetical protein